MKFVSSPITELFLGIKQHTWLYILQYLHHVSVSELTLTMQNLWLVLTLLYIVLYFIYYEYYDWIVINTIESDQYDIIR